MSQDDMANELREEAMRIRASEPRNALDLLWEAARKHPDTSTVVNLVIDDLIYTSWLGSFWDDAIEACTLAQKVRPHLRERYALKAQAFQLDKEGRHVEATEMRLKGAVWRSPSFWV
jgi:hypothetical protein